MTHDVERTLSGPLVTKGGTAYEKPTGPRPRFVVPSIEATWPKRVPGILPTDSIAERIRKLVRLGR